MLIEEIGYEVGKEFKVGVSMNGNTLIINTPKCVGLNRKQDKIDLVEELTVKMVEYIRREFKEVFDVVADVTYEKVKFTFIG